MFTLKKSLLLLLLSSGAESKLGKPEATNLNLEVEVPEQRFIVQSDSTLQAAMKDPNHVGRFAADVDTSTVDWDVVVVDNASEINKVAEEHTVLERDNVRLSLSIKTEEMSKKEQRKLVQQVPWGINNVFEDNLPDWDDLVGSNRTADVIKVCIIDSGYYQNHVDLPLGFDATGGEGGDWKEDGCEHGSHVAGTMLAKNNNAGVVGVFPGQQPLIVKVFGTTCGWSWSSTLIIAMQLCQSSGAKVINMSLGGSYSSTTEQNAINAMYDEGMLLVAAAGNGGNSAFSYPASYDNVVSVAAIDSNNNIASFSQRNNQVNIAAPGVSVLSTDGNSNLITTLSGTSMASPHVAALASLLWNEFPTCTNTEIIDAMEQGAEDLGDEGKDNSYGHGAVRYYPSRALLAAGCGNVLPTISPAPTPTPLPTSSFVLNLTTDTYPAETSWSLTLGGVAYANGGGYTTPNADQIPFTTELSGGDYTLMFIDSYGDGICCSYGSGSYEAKLEGVIVASGGEFASSESKLISVVTASPAPTPAITPVPTKATAAPITAPSSSPTGVITLAPTKSTEAPTGSSPPPTGAITPVPTKATAVPTTAPSSSPTGVITPVPTKSTPVPTASTTTVTSDAPTPTASTPAPTTSGTVGTPTPTSETTAVTTASPTESPTLVPTASTTTVNSDAPTPTASTPAPTTSGTVGTPTPTSETTAVTTASPTESTPVPTASTTSPVSTSTGVPTQSPVSGTIDEQCADDLAFAFTPFTKHWAVCGADDKCDDEEGGVFENDELHEVRCCSATQKDGWSKRNGCDVWVESKLGGLCYAAKTWREATCICEKYDARLCTKVENESDCGKQTGCAYDKELVWTNTPDDSSTVIPSPSSSPVVSSPTTTGVPTQSPLSSPVVSTGVPTQSPVSGTIDEQCADDLAFAFTPFTKHWAVCGADDRCDDEEDGVFENDELHEVRCCSETEKFGWSKRNGCDVWVESKLGGLCYASKTWHEATCICEKYDARLCTKVENESNCGKQTGCAYDKELVWTNTPDEQDEVTL